MSWIGKALEEYEEEGFISFHTPGHKGKGEFFKGLHFPQQDLTELPGLDMLHAPEGVIYEAQKRSAEVYGSDACFYLVNGGTVGNQGMLMALAQHKGRAQNSPAKVLVERQSHRSVMSGLILSGMDPEYIPSIVHPDFCLPLGLKMLEKEAIHSYKGIHITYPRYYGSLPDLQSIIQLRDDWASGCSVLVDQAHGAHYLHDLLPPCALQLGADGVLVSAHKTLPALTQSALLHIQGERIPFWAQKQALELLQSSSPSYLLMASLERAIEYALDRDVWAGLYSAVQDLYAQVGRELRVLNPKDKGTYGIHDVDWTKILVNTLELGIPAPQCVDHLRKVYGIEPELWDEENILFLLGMGNTPQEVEQLAKGLLSLKELNPSRNNRSSSTWLKQRREHKRAILMEEIPCPPKRITPRAAYFAPKRKVSLAESVGKIVGETLSPYPPGVPWIVIGEEMTTEIRSLIREHQGRWQGWADLGQSIWIIEEV